MTRNTQRLRRLLDLRKRQEEQARVQLAQSLKKAAEISDEVKARTEALERALDGNPEPRVRSHLETLMVMAEPAIRAAQAAEASAMGDPRSSANGTGRPSASRAWSGSKTATSKPKPSVAEPRKGLLDDSASTGVIAHDDTGDADPQPGPRTRGESASVACRSVMMSTVHLRQHLATHPMSAARS